MDAEPLLTAIVGGLSQARLEAILIGNAAAAIRGAPVTTLDFDFMFRSAPANLRKAIPAGLTIVGDKVRIGEVFTGLLEGLGPHLEPGDVIGISARENDNVLVEILLPRELPKTLLQLLNSGKSLFHRMPS